MTRSLGRRQAFSPPRVQDQEVVHQLMAFARGTDNALWYKQSILPIGCAEPTALQ